MATWVIVVDDDPTNLQMAGHILSRSNMRVTALRSGKALMDYISRNSLPELILLDIKMPEMDGFETLARLRAYEREAGKDETPVIFLTADEDAATEKHGFEVGVSDFIRKPFDPDVLLRRIGNIVTNQEKMHSLRAEATTDKLTGFLNKAAAGFELTNLCTSKSGCLMMIDLDSFKLVNDIYGHEMGDRVLISFSRIITANLPPESRCARIGGDEFTAFCCGMDQENKIAKFTEYLNKELQADAKRLMGEDMDIPLGASVGAVFVPDQGTEYEELLKLADKALYTVKKNGKHGYALFRSDFMEEENNAQADLDIDTLSSILGERNIPNVALQLGKDAFSYVYRFLMRYIKRNNKTACKVLFSAHPGSDTSESEYKELCDEFAEHISVSLRKTDVFTRIRMNRYFVFLTDIREDSVEKVLTGVLSCWHEKYGDRVTISFETQFIENEKRSCFPENPRIAIADDDTANLQAAGHILSKGGFHVTAYRSGQALAEHIENDIPELILLDIKMPGLDGFGTFRKLKNMEKKIAEIPVIFLTADEDPFAEKEGLALGAKDFIKKPFIPEVLLLRVRIIIELVRLQRSLAEEVEKKTKENKNLFMHVVHSLAEAIDAKDTYTNGHSDRVAEYAREIAKRAGWSEQDQNEIYMLGLLHDVGKIGVPDAVINKPSQLTDDEYSIIKGHPVHGDRILRSITEMPRLAVGARSHHERYDGHGYPDGLSGKDIPAEARIIAVADSYDAMTSRRSYHDIYPQEKVRSEIQNGRGTQFDPDFADIMLDMIDEDTGYDMREK